MSVPGSQDCRRRCDYDGASPPQKCPSEGLAEDTGRCWRASRHKTPNFCIFSVKDEVGVRSGKCPRGSLRSAVHRLSALKFSISEPSPRVSLAAKSAHAGVIVEPARQPGIPLATSTASTTAARRALCWACKRHAAAAGTVPHRRSALILAATARPSAPHTTTGQGGYGLADGMVSSAVGFICILFLFSAVLACFRTRGDALAHAAGSRNEPVPMGCAATAHRVSTAVAVSGPCGQAGGASGLPVAGRCCPQRVAVGTRRGAHVHHHHGSYGGYGGGSVAMNAGMGVSLRDAPSHSQQCGSRAASAGP